MLQKPNSSAGQNELNSLGYLETFCAMVLDVQEAHAIFKNNFIVFKRAALSATIS